MTNQELIEKCKSRLEKLKYHGGFKNTVIELTDLLTRFEKAQKENEQLKNLLEQSVDSVIEMNGFAFGNLDNLVYDIHIALNPNPPKPTTNE